MFAPKLPRNQHVHMHVVKSHSEPDPDTFSEMVAATRNPALGRALPDEGYTVGAKKSARCLEQRVMHGELMSGSSKSERRAAFGLQGQVSRPKKAL